MRRHSSERRGLAYLTSPDPDYGVKREWKVRIYYTSEGGELLCVDSAAMSRRKAESLAASLPPSREGRGDYFGRGYSSAAHAIEINKADYDGAPRFGARLVILPSQMGQP